MRIFSLYILLVFVFFLSTAATGVSAKTYGTIHHLAYTGTVDADLITVNIKGIHQLVGDQIQVRLAGILTPSLNSRCAREKDMARQAMAIVDLLLKKAKRISLENAGRGRTFQIIGAVMADGIDIREVLVKKGLAVWQSSSKDQGIDWCN